MFYLTTHSTHFILRLYSMGHNMLKDHSVEEFNVMGGGGGRGDL